MTGIKYPDKEENKYYKKADRINNGFQGYKYGPYKPGRVKDNGEPLKKNGRKKGDVLKKEVEFGAEVGKVVNLMTFGATKIKHPENIEKGKKPKQPLNIAAACLEAGTTITSFYYYLKKYPKVKEEYEKLKESRREYLREVSEMNVEKALTGKMKKLSDKDIVDYSFRMLERTDKNYNPKQVQEVTVEEVNVERSTEDILSDITDLLR